MKKNALLNLWIVVMLLVPAGVFAAETAGKEAVVSKDNASASTKSSQDGKTQKNDHDAFNEKSIVVHVVRAEPVATVSGAEKKEAHAVPAKEEAVSKKTSSKSSSEKKDVETPVKTETVSELNTEEMQKRWKNFVL